ncbi:helicase associated domain-containing protein [Streptomyces sp. NPDC048696]|uniref:helicase associated domain-containing protein n=1 Tax=Streptomyces sp. NPDC048696 TaxID=3365585 RepID=UPI00371E5003
MHGHLAIPATAPAGQFLVSQRGLARKELLDPDREAQLTALGPTWTLPYGPDWHRKYHLLRHHIETGNDPTTLRRDTMLDGVKVGAWLHRHFTTWNALNPGQRHLLTRLGLTPDQILLPAGPKTATPSTGPRRRRSFEQHALLLRAFVERYGRPPGAREWIEAGAHRRPVRCASWRELLWVIGWAGVPVPGVRWVGGERNETCRGARNDLFARCPHGMDELFPRSEGFVVWRVGRIHVVWY